MSSFTAANQVRIVLKMKLCNYAWYLNSGVAMSEDDYLVNITVKRLDNNIRKIIPSKLNGVHITTELE